MSLKSGIKTTEFWIVILTNLSTLFETFKGNIDPKWGAVITAVLALGYAVVRMFTKAAASLSTSTPPTA